MYELHCQTQSQSLGCCAVLAHFSISLFFKLVILVKFMLGKARVACEGKYQQGI